MHAERQTRTIPRALLKAIVRIYRPEAAAVLVRRNPPASEPGGADRLSVAAFHSTRGTLRDGMEFKIGEGQVGIVAERQQVMVRKDFEEDQLWSYERSRVSAEPKWDIIAPMVVGEKTLGVLAVSRPDRHHDTEREVLEMIARVGALTTQNVAAYRQKEVEAEVDKLTKIFNKGALLKRLDRAIIRARKEGGKTSVFMFDLDNFKVYNDTNGHLAGDRLLTKLSELVTETVRCGRCLRPLWWRGVSAGDARADGRTGNHSGKHGAQEDRGVSRLKVARRSRLARSPSAVALRASPTTRRMASSCCARPIPPCIVPRKRAGTGSIVPTSPASIPFADPFQIPLKMTTCPPPRSLIAATIVDRVPAERKRSPRPRVHD